MKVKSLKLYDVRFGNQWFDEILDHWDYKDFLAHPDWRKGWISFDSALYNESDNRIYLGITSFNADIFMAYDCSTEKFIDIGYKKIADPFDAKFHRSLVKRNADGCIYGAIALLHCNDRYFDAPGGAIIRYNPETGEMTRLATPMPHIYIQAIALDQERDLLYCQCFPPECIITYNIKSGEVKNLGVINGASGFAQGENIVLDDNSNLWSTWALTRAWQSSAGVESNRLLKVPAGAERIDYLKAGLPKRDGSYGYEKMESLFNLGDGYLYASAANGSLYRINTENGEAQYLFTPVSDRSSRLSSLTLGKDGYAYGVTGREGKCELLRFDFRNTSYELLGSIVDDSGEACWQVHDITVGKNGVLYACENDNPYRSGYLWQIEI